MQQANTLRSLSGNELAGALEAILMVVDQPVSQTDLARALEVDVETVQQCLQGLAREYETQSRGFELRNIANGWRIYSAPRFDPLVSQFIVGTGTQKLSRAALETLAIIAYKQPITRARIREIRGVNVDSVVRNLQARGLVTEDGQTLTGASLYRTTNEFMERMGIASLDELAPLAPHLPKRDELSEISKALEEK